MHAKQPKLAYATGENILKKNVTITLENRLVTSKKIWTYVYHMTQAYVHTDLNTEKEKWKKNEDICPHKDLNTEFHSSFINS